MKKALIVVDMQNDFITGALANKEGQKIVAKIADFIRNFEGDVVATRDTHEANYMETQEGRKLPVPHCIRGTKGWEIVSEIQAALDEKDSGDYIVTYMNKPTFGCIGLGEHVDRNLYDEVVLVGVCTDICVISNAMVIKASDLEAEVTVLEDLCAGVTPDSHKTALEAMKACQINVMTSEKLCELTSSKIRELDER